MQNGQLLSHIDTDLVTREQLALVETPDATRSFKPVPHIELINTLDEVLGLNQISWPLLSTDHGVCWTRRLFTDGQSISCQRMIFELLCCLGWRY